MKRNFVNRVCGVVLAGVVAIGLAGCGASGNAGSNSGNASNSSTNSSSTTDASKTNNQIADPYTDYDSLADAEKAVGFDITLPDVPEGYPVISYRVLSGENMIEVIYSDKATDSEDFKEAYRVRKAPGTDDISGDSNVYSNSETKEISGISVNLKGEGDNVKLATWVSGNYTYAVSFDMDGAGVSKTEAEDIIAAIK